MASNNNPRIAPNPASNDVSIPGSPTDANTSQQAGPSSKRKNDVSLTSFMNVKILIDLRSTSFYLALRGISKETSEGQLQLPGMP